MKEVSNMGKWEDEGGFSLPEPPEDYTGLVDTESAGTDEPIDAMSPEAAPGLSLIVLMRIYDVQMALYRHFDEQGAVRLYDLHSQGKILGSLPFIDND